MGKERNKNSIIKKKKRRVGRNQKERRKKISQRILQITVELQRQTEAVWLLLLVLCSIVQDNIHDPPANPIPRGSVCAAAVLTLSVNC